MKNFLTDYYSFTLPLQCESDVFLNEEFVNHGFTPLQLWWINRCRLHLQVTTLSDILTGDGSSFTKSVYSCHQDSTTPNYYNWLQQPRPGPKSIAIWRKALRTCFPHENCVLHLTLRDWLYPLEAEWQWFYVPTSHTVYQKQGNNWRIWRCRVNRAQMGHQPCYYYFSNGIILPTNSCRDTIERINNNELFLTGWSTHLQGSSLTLQPVADGQWMLDDTSITKGSMNGIEEAIIISLESVMDPL